MRSWPTPKIDYPLFFLLILLTGIGLIILYSAGIQTHYYTIKKQLLNIIFSFSILLIIAQIHPRFYHYFAYRLYFFTLCLLLVVLLFGHIGKGAQRWLNLGFIRFQPSELMKIALPLALSRYLTDRPIPPSVRNILISLFIITLPTLLIAKQPDLGTALLIMFTGIITLFLTGISWTYLAYGLFTSAISLPIIWHFMHPYQKQRILIFLTPELSPLGAGYNIIQSKIAIGSGGLLGKGWLHSTQAYLKFLPEKTTDFIFAVFAEEFGFIGAMLLLTLLFLIIVRGFIISKKPDNSFMQVLAGTLTMIFFFYSLINIGMVSGMFPVVGIPLPLISYGGTSMLTLLMSFGMLMSISNNKNYKAY